MAVTAGSVSCSMFWQVPTMPLHDAAMRGDVAAIEVLVMDGAEVDEADDMGATALYWAARGGHRLGPHACAEDAARPAVISALLVEKGFDPQRTYRRTE